MTQVFTAQRIDSDGLSAIARWLSPNGTFLCWTLEPGADRQPHPGIPAGDYALRLRTEGEKHAAYKIHYAAKYGIGWHRGMIEIVGVPGCAEIEFHCGNTLADTLGCFLAGEQFVAPPGNGSGHFEVERSRDAYEKTYPILRDNIVGGAALLRVLPIGTPLA